MRHGKHRETIHFIVVSRVVAIRPFRCQLALLDVAFEHDFRAGRHFEVVGNTLHHFGFGAAQQARESVFRKGIRNRRHRAENGRRIGTERHRNRETLARMRCAPLLEIKRAAAMRQPAHDQFVFAN
ncbi:hypothetical protein D3C76_1166470 [compost metagenome]